ncbi:MAG: hypothetical protein Q4G68_09510 [Planctomycetia bacterium]|nr:hypothetical protein [Planctomycetia bacterium]
MKKSLYLVLLLSVVLSAGCCKACKNGDNGDATAPRSVDASCAACNAKDAPKDLESLDPFKPTLFANLGDTLYTPDGMVVDAEKKIAYLNVPNFAFKDENGKKLNSHQGGYLLKVSPDGKYETLLEYPIYEPTGQTGPMGISIGPDGNLYVCDNQFFYNTDYQSRILRVVMKDGKPTGDVQTVVEGIKLANAVTWFNNRMFYTDSNLQIEDQNAEEWIGSGAVFMFEGDEVLKAGTEGNPPIKVTSADTDSHCLTIQKARKIGRGDNTGADGMTVDTKTGVIYFGHFGDGRMFAIYPNEDGSYSGENTVCIYDPIDVPADGETAPGSGLVLQCCDGIYYDAATNKVFQNDSLNNAIWYFTPVAKGEKIQYNLLWKNGDCDGNDGLLDQPCECVVIDGKLIIVGFDWPFPGMVNTKAEAPGTLSVIDISSLQAPAAN